MSNGHSVTTWIGLLRDGDHEAAERLWERYFGRLVTFARGKLHGVSRRAVDEEDIAISAFHSFCQAAERFPRLNNRDDLWQVLVMLTARKAHAERREQQTVKRGGTTQPDRPRTPALADVELDEIIGNEPTPEFAASVAEQFEVMLAKLPDAELRQVARLRLEEFNTEEIAAQLGIAERSVRRKLMLIRSYWENDGPP